MTPLVNVSGILAIGALSVAMILAARPVFLEHALNGLDKMYRLHKWLGISGASLALAHLAAVQLPKWMISMGFSIVTVLGFAMVWVLPEPYRSWWARYADSGVVAMMALLLLPVPAMGAPYSGHSSGSS